MGRGRRERQTVADASGNGVTGTIVNAAFTWVAGAPFMGRGTRRRSPGPTRPRRARARRWPSPSSATTAIPTATVLTVPRRGAPAHGTAAMNANGTIRYTPAAGYSGGDTFTYAISDNQGGVATG